MFLHMQRVFFVWSWWCWHDRSHSCGAFKLPVGVNLSVNVSSCLCVYSYCDQRQIQQRYMDRWC